MTSNFSQTIFILKILGWVDSDFVRVDQVDPARDGAYQYLREINNGKRRQTKAKEKDVVIRKRTATRFGKTTAGKTITYITSVHVKLMHMCLIFFRDFWCQKWTQEP